MGIKPDRLCGFSVGEYVAACVSGVMTFEDALHMVIKRADAIRNTPRADRPAVSLSEFRKDLESIPFQQATVPFVSNVSGAWVADETDWPDHWMKHLENPTDFNACLHTLLKDDSLFLEISPNSEVSALIQSSDTKKSSIGCSCQITPTRKGTIPFHDSLVSLWRNGCSIDWTQWFNAKARRVSLPGYPFKKNPFWIITRTEGFRTTLPEPSTSPPDSTQTLSNDPINRVVTRIWQDFFKINAISPDQDFFSLGGDSLMGLGLVEEINAKLKLKLTFGELVMHPTLGALIDYIRSSKEHHQPDYQFPMLFPVQPKGTRPPLFLVAGAHANRYFDIENMKSSYEDDFLSYFSMLVRSLGMDQPVYGFRPKGLLLEEEPHANVQQMATHYIQALKKIQPQGPYFVGGECIGGVVAYEMAVQLQRSGEQIAQLIMMDTARPSFLFQFKEEYRRFRKNIRKGIRKAFAYLGSPDEKRLLQKIIPWTSLALSVMLPITNNQRMKRRVAMGSYQYWRKLLQYRPKGYQGRVTFIVNEQWNKQRFLLGWKKELGSRVSIEVVPGGHVERMKVYGDISGRILKNVIDQALLEYGLHAYKASKN
jgi:thioesterase domain-containing protein/aryl carrier-like protein